MKKLLVIFIVLLLVSCKDLKKGIVYKKEYEPSKTTFIVTVVGKTTVLVPNYVQERYIIYIKGNLNGKKEENYFYVTEKEYEKIKINDIYGVD